MKEMNQRCAEGRLHLHVSCEPEKWKRIANSEKRKHRLPKQESYLASYIFWTQSNEFLCPCKMDPEPNPGNLFQKWLSERETCRLWNNKIFALRATYYIYLLFEIMCALSLGKGKALIYLFPKLWNQIIFCLSSLYIDQKNEFLTLEVFC